MPRSGYVIRFINSVTYFFVGVLVLVSESNTATMTSCHESGAIILKA